LISMKGGWAKEKIFTLSPDKKENGNGNRLFQGQLMKLD